MNLWNSWSKNGKTKKEHWGGFCVVCFLFMGSFSYASDREEILKSFQEWKIHEQVEEDHSLQPTKEEGALLEKINLVTTMEPLRAIVQMVVGSLPNVKSVVAGKENLHEYTLKPFQISFLRKADLIFMFHEKFENFIPYDFFLPKIVFYKNSPHIVFEDYMEMDSHEAHHSHEKHDHGHDHGHSHDHFTKDYHVWLDPLLAQEIVLYTYDQVKQKYPKLQGFFRRNVLQALKDLHQLHTILEKAFARHKDKNFFVFHNAYGYFQRRYGLNSFGVMELSGRTPSIRDMQKLVEKSESFQQACIFMDVQERKILQLGEENMETFFTTSHIVIGELDPLGGNLKKGYSYGTFLTHFSNGFLQCFEDLEKPVVEEF